MSLPLGPVVQWDYLVEILSFDAGGWRVVTDEPPIDEPAPYHELSDYFTELGDSRWELTSMTPIPSTERVVLVFKRPA
jgi:hypothetical protein